jgi:hypothetical protein
MWSYDDTLFIEPGELELLAQAAYRTASARRPRALAAVARATILQALAHTLQAFAARPEPPVYVLAPASSEQAAWLAQHLAGG